MAVINITLENFEAEVIKSEKTVLVDFWAPWCGPCRMLSPVVDEIGEERTDIKVGKVNVDEQEELAMRFGIMSIPTLIVFKNGEAVKKTLETGKSAIVLIPEIGLTSEAVGIYYAEFGEKLAVIHSMLSIGERIEDRKSVV